MFFELSPKRQLICEPTDTIFVNNIQYLLSLSHQYLEKIVDINSINDNILFDLGAECWDISKMKTSLDMSHDLSDVKDYPKIFIGQYSQDFIEIMLKIQFFWQIIDDRESDNFSSADKKGFYNTLKEMHAMLENLNHSIIN